MCGFHLQVESVRKKNDSTKLLTLEVELGTVCCSRRRRMGWGHSVWETPPLCCTSSRSVNMLIKKCKLGGGGGGGGV